MTQNQIEEGITRCKSKIDNLLYDAETICNKRNTATVAVGLYTIALEECGKLLLLQDVLTTSANPDGTFNVNEEIFGRGRGGHTTSKFNRILHYLPDPCKLLGNIVGGFSSGFSDEFQKTKEDVLTDFQARKNIFYVDWDDSNQKWKGGLDIESKDLKNVIKDFRNWMKQNI